MSVFRTLAYLSPLIVGFGVAAALALTAGKPAKRRAIAAGAVPGAVLLLLLLTSFADSAALWLPVAILLATFAILVAGVYLLCESARAPREVSQIIAGLVVCFLMATLFIFAPIIRDSADAGASGATIASRIDLAMGVSPFVVIGDSIFNVDLLHTPYFYRTDLAGFQHGRPSWPATSAGYALAGVVLASLGFGVRKVLKQ